MEKFFPRCHRKNVRCCQASLSRWCKLCWCTRMFGGDQTFLATRERVNVVKIASTTEYLPSENFLLRHKSEECHMCHPTRRPARRTKTFLFSSTSLRLFSSSYRRFSRRNFVSSSDLCNENVARKLLTPRRNKFARKKKSFSLIFREIKHSKNLWKHELFKHGKENFANVYFDDKH